MRSKQQRAFSLSFSHSPILSFSPAPLIDLLLRRDELVVRHRGHRREGARARALLGRTARARRAAAARVLARVRGAALAAVAAGKVRLRANASRAAARVVPTVLPDRLDAKPSVKSSRVIRTSRWLLCGFALLFVVVLVIAWTKSTHYIHQMETNKDEIGAAFNDLFCETRALQVCVQEDELEKLLVVIGGDQSTNTSESVSTSAAKATTLAIWLRCRDLLVENHGRVSSQQLKLLADCNSTAATDTWCENHFLNEANGDFVDLRAAAVVSPFDLNPEIFQSLKVEWPTRYTGDAMFLPAVVVFTTALTWCLKKLTREASDGFELIDMKARQHTSAGSTPHLVV